MNKDYTIYFKEQNTRVGIYLVPHRVEIMQKSLFTIKVGFIDLDDELDTFHCLDADRMTIDVMESIVSSWRQWEKGRGKKK